MLYVRFPLSLRNVEDLLHERGIEISHETVRFWWNRFGPMFAAEIRRRRVDRMRAGPQWRWHVDEAFVKINGRTHYLWRAVDHEGEVLESFVSKESFEIRQMRLQQAIPQLEAAGMSNEAHQLRLEDKALEVRKARTIQKLDAMLRSLRP